MESINQVMLSGKIAGEPTITTGRDGQKSAVFTLRTNHIYKGNDGEKYSDEELHIVRLKRASTIAKYLRDNKSLIVIGRLSYSDDAGDAYILAETISFPG